MVATRTRSGRRGYVALTLEVEREGSQYVSRCVELDVASCGDDLDEAIQNVIEATTDYLNAIERHGQRARIFRERGIRVRRAIPESVAVDRRVAVGTVIQSYVAELPISA